MSKTMPGMGCIVAGAMLITAFSAGAAAPKSRMIASAGSSSKVQPTTDSTTETKAATAAATRPAEEGSAGGVGATLKFGTLGIGGEATIGVSDYLGFRFGLNRLSAGPSIERDEGTINTDLQWMSYGAMADLHVFGGGFRITGGGLINKNGFKLSADLAKSVTLDGQQYELDNLNGEVTFAELAPYAGIGYGNAVGADGRWHFSCDFGVMLQGEQKVSASATASDPALQPYVDEALAKEVASIQDDANAFKYYPVISIGVSYRF